MQVLDLKGYIKQIKKALEHDHLYNEEELRKLKTDLRNLEKTNKMMRERQNMVSVSISTCLIQLR